MRKSVFAVLFMVCAAFALAQTGYEPPKEVILPGFIGTIIAFLTSKLVFPFAAATIVMGVVQGLRIVVSLFGAKLGEKGIYIAGLLISLLTALAGAGADGVIAGDEWVVLITAAITFVGAVLGYKVLFSEAAKARIKGK